MIQIIIGLEMSLAKQYFDDWLVFIKPQDRNFSRTEKKSNHNKHVKGFLIIRGGNIFSIRSDNGVQITTYCQHQVENYFGR